MAIVTENLEKMYKSRKVVNGVDVYPGIRYAGYGTRLNGAGVSAAPVFGPDH